MNKLELQEKRLNLQTELKNLIGESEQRMFTDEDNTKLVDLRTQIDEIDSEIRNIEKENKKIELKNNTNKTQEKMEVRLFDLIKETVDGNVKDEHRQYINGNKISYRTINAGTATQGQENVPEDKLPLFMAIRNASVLNKIGATWFGNAVGDLSIPKYAGSNVGWKGEIATADNGEGAFSEVILQPKRLTAYIDISKQFLLQDANNAEALLIGDLAEAVAEKLDETIFGAESGTTTRPAGLFADTGYTESGATSLSAITYDDVLKHECAVEEKNGKDYIFIASPNVKFALKGTQMASGLQMVYNGNEIDGYKAVVSNSVVKGGMITMVPSDLVVAEWGNIDITVDNVSKAVDGQIRIVVNAYYDAKLRNDRISAEIFA